MSDVPQQPAVLAPYATVGLGWLAVAVMLVVAMGVFSLQDVKFMVPAIIVSHAVAFGGGVASLVKREPARVRAVMAIAGTLALAFAVMVLFV